jgi:hypothetical protein
MYTPGSGGSRISPAVLGDFLEMKRDSGAHLALDLLGVSPVATQPGRSGDQAE